MATTVNTGDYENYVGSKHPTPQALISSARKALIYVVKLTFDANYATGGYTDASLKRRGATKIDFVIWGNSKVGPQPYYNKTNDKVMFHTENGTELASASALPNGEEIEALVFART